MRCHQWVDQRSLALHEAVAAKLEAHLELLDVARQNLERSFQQNPATAVREWRRILDSTPLPEVVALLRSTSDEAARQALAGGAQGVSVFHGNLLTAEHRTALRGVLRAAAAESRR